LGKSSGGPSLPGVPELSTAKRSILQLLQRADALTTAEIASRLGVTGEAVRQHLDALEAAAMVARSADGTGRRGRPSHRWSLGAQAIAVFTDRHADLAVDLIEAIRTTLGDAAVDEAVASRADRQLPAYASAISGAPLAERVERLAELRTTEGYAADVVTGADGEMVLVEHHCPIADAARTCGALCSAELSLFRRALGADVVVERVQHLMAGDRRCAYRIAAAPGSSGSAAPPGS
jgi:predicted ArsR family transcriptional regulator